MPEKTIAGLDADLKKLNNAKEVAAREIAAQGRALSVCLDRKGDGDFDYSECIKALFKLTRNIDDLHSY